MEKVQLGTEFDTQPILSKWNNSWQSPSFRHKLIFGLILFFGLMPIFPIFYQYIETRNGFNQTDLLLEFIKPYDVSTPIFLITWTIALLGITRSLQNPAIFINFMYGVVIMNLIRFMTILLIPCDPPAGLIAISDPISNSFYGQHFITKDLFFSGHTALPFLLFLVLKKRRDRSIALIATVLMGFLVLIQHVHFTVDVVFAPLFALISYNMSCKVCKSNISLNFKPLARI